MMRAANPRTHKIVEATEKEWLRELRHNPEVLISIFVGNAILAEEYTCPICGPAKTPRFKGAVGLNVHLRSNHKPDALAEYYFKHFIKNSSITSITSNAASPAHPGDGIGRPSPGEKGQTTDQKNLGFDLSSTPSGRENQHD